MMTELTHPITLRRQEMLRNWGLQEMPPFDVTPQRDSPLILRNIFTGRAEELERSILPLYHGRNILVRGMWGVGKTTFILRLLRELWVQAQAVEQRVLPLYIGNFHSSAVEDLYRYILFALAASLREKDPLAERVHDELKGLHVTYSQSKEIEGSVDVHLFDLSGTLGWEVERNLTLENPEPYVIDLLRKARQEYYRVVIAIDDLDKGKPEEGQNIRRMLEGALPLIRQHDCAFILTGRTLTVVQDLYDSMLAIFDEAFTLNPLATEELIEIAVKTLNVARAVPRADALPFTDDVIRDIAQRSLGIPRLFNKICIKMLETAIRLNCATLDEAGFQQCFPEIQASVSTDVEPSIRYILHMAQKYGGLSGQMPDEDLEKLGFDTFVELLPVLDDLVRRDLMVRQDDERGARYLPSPLTTTATNGESRGLLPG